MKQLHKQLSVKHRRDEEIPIGYSHRAKVPILTQIKPSSPKISSGLMFYMFLIWVYWVNPSLKMEDRKSTRLNSSHSS